MKGITVSQVNKKIESLPQNLLQEVDQFIDYLTNRSTQTDWSEALSESQLGLIGKGKKDIEEGRVISHKEAKQKINEYIRTKSNSGNCLVRNSPKNLFRRN